jgi:hypothetical protein
MHTKLRTVLCLVMLASFASGCVLYVPPHIPPPRDVLAISDDGVGAAPGDPATFLDDSVKFFDAQTGERLASPGVAPNSGLVGPAAVLFPDGPRRGLLVVNQNLSFGRTDPATLAYDR